MQAEKTYWIRNKTSRSYASTDNEEHAALVSTMRNLARFCRIKVLTYRVQSGNLSMLVSCPDRNQQLELFQDAKDEPPGSGDQRLLKHLRNQYSAAHVRELEVKLKSLRENGGNVKPLIERYTHRIGVPKKFAEGINEAYTRWIKKNRPQLYGELNGKVCRKHIFLTHIEELQQQLEIATGMDEAAVEHDDGGEPRHHWCGFADALRGDEDALDGLRELMRSPANNAQDILGLGYCSQHSATRPIPPQPTNQTPVEVREDAHSERDTDTETFTDTAAGTARETDTESSGSYQAQTPEALATSASPQPIGRLTKLILIGIVVAVLGGGAVFSYKEWRKYQASQQAISYTSERQATEDVEQNTDTENQRQLAAVTSRLYEPEARQLAEDFAKSSDSKTRLKMCRDPEKVKEHLSSYPPQALDESASDVVFMDVVDLGGIMAARFFVQFEDRTSRLLCVVPTLDGLRVDWDGYARYNTAAWQELLDGTTKSAELRVFTQRTDFFAFSYRDEAKWLSFVLKMPDRDDILYAYAARGTTTAKLLEAAMPVAGSGKNVQLTLRVSSTDDGYKQKQFTIDRVHAFGWVRPEVDIEDTYRATIHEIEKAVQEKK